MHFLYFNHIFAKTNLKKKRSTTKIISEKFSTNPESFNGFGRGRRIDLAISDGMAHYSTLVRP